MTSPVYSPIRFTLPWAIFVTIVFWAAIYLPCLGTIHFKGEEGRRVLPAVSMIETGDWVIPSVGGERYFRKPPLLNWGIAASIQLTGEVSEWSTRLPSAFSVLALALGMLLFTRRWLGVNAALAAMVMLLVNAALMEKGRLAELEAFAIATYGLALLAWVDGEIRGVKFTHWALAGFFLGLALLTKGPLPTLLYFYLPVLLWFWNSKRMRELLSAGHIACLLLTWGPVAIWSAAVFAQVSAQNVSGVWTEELAQRVVTASYSVGISASLFFQSIVNFLPWVLIAPWLWQGATVARLPETQRGLFVALRQAATIGFVVVACLPRTHGRYTNQLMVILALLLAWALVHSELPRWASTVWRRVLQTVTICAALAVPVVLVWLRPSMPYWFMALAVLAGAAMFWKLLPHCRDSSAMSIATGASVLPALGVLWIVLGLVGPSITTPQYVGSQEILSLLPQGQRLVAVRPGLDKVLPHLGLRVTYVDSLQNLPKERPLFVMINREPDREALRNQFQATMLPVHLRPTISAYEIWRLEGEPGASTNIP